MTPTSRPCFAVQILMNVKKLDCGNRFIAEWSLDAVILATSAT